MALSRIGIRQPHDAVTGAGPHAYMENGMHYERCSGDDGRIYVAADHEDVGQVAWFDATEADWQEIYDAADFTA